MKTEIDDKTTSIYMLNDNSHKHVHIYAGKSKNAKWKKIRVDEDTIPNCVSIHTFPDKETIVIGIPASLRQAGIVEIDLPSKERECCCICGYKIQFIVEPGDPTELSKQDIQSVKIDDKWVCGTCGPEISRKLVERK